MWDGIQPTKDWIDSHIPEVNAFLGWRGGGCVHDIQILDQHRPLTDVYNYRFYHNYWVAIIINSLFSVFPPLSSLSGSMPSREEVGRRLMTITLPLTTRH